MSTPEMIYSRYLGQKFTPSDSSFVVASVEVGNTTTKCILTAADLKTGKTDLIGKYVCLTRDARPPNPDEIVFGETISGVRLTRQSLAELVRDTVFSTLFENRMTVDDVHFVVRSTGVTNGAANHAAAVQVDLVPDYMGTVVQALADGCLMAGFTPRKMTGYLSLNKMPEKLQAYSLLDRVYFDGAVAGVLPPKCFAENIISNEMEGELAAAGLKEAGKHTSIDFRNPCLAIDMGTTLSGRIIGNEKPYAKTHGNFCGYAGAVSDYLIQKIDAEKQSAFELFGMDENQQPVSSASPAASAPSSKPSSFLSRSFLSSVPFLSSPERRGIKSAQNEIRSLINVMEVPENRTQFGPFLVNPAAAKKSGFTLIGCDVGENGSDLSALSDIGYSVYENYGFSAVSDLMDEVMSDIAVDLVKCVIDAGLLFDGATIGITGRAGTTGKKPDLILQKVSRMIQSPEKRILFAEDGLARGAAVMARCMNSLGCPKNPLGGNKGGGCIMAERKRFQQV
ncbi:methanogenesis marker 14 protein [Methanolapillus africanus]